MAGAKIVWSEPDPTCSPDGVVVSTPASLHVASIRTAIAHGAPVFVEKPMAIDRAGAEEILRLDGPPVFVMHTWRYHPGILLLSDIVRGRELGTVETIRSTRSNWTSPRTDVDPVWTLLPHDISIALELLGGLPSPVAAHAEFHRGRPVGMLSILEYGNAALVLEVSTRCPGKRREIAVRCEKGVASLPNDKDGRLELRGDDGGVETRDWPVRPGALYLELAAFIDYLRGGSPPKCCAATGARIVDVVTTLREMAGIASC